MPPRKKKAAKKKVEDSEEEEIEVDDEQTDFSIVVDDADARPFTDDYEKLEKFDSLEKLPSEVVFDIFSFLPSLPYYFKLQLLNKFYRDKFKAIIAESKHLDISSVNLLNIQVWDKACEIVKDCSATLKSLTLGDLSHRWNQIKDNMIGKCKKLEELSLITPTHYFSSLFRKADNYYGYYAMPAHNNFDEDKTNRDVWCDQLKTLNVIGLEKPRKGRRNNAYLLTAATMKYILEKFPKIQSINFILTNYTEQYVQFLYENCTNNRKKILEYRKKGGSTDMLYDRGNNWYEESLGLVDFEIPLDVKVRVLGSIGKLNSLDAARTIVETYNINPNTKFDFMFQKNSCGTLLDQIIGSRAAAQQKLQVINYLLNHGSLLSNLSANSWFNILKQPTERIKKLLEIITKWVATRNEGKMLTSSTFSEVVNRILDSDTFTKNLQVLLDNGWADVKDTDQDFITPSIINHDICQFMIDKAGCKINRTKSTTLLINTLTSQHFRTIPIVLKLVPEQLTEKTPFSGLSTLSYCIALSETVPDKVISYIFGAMVKPDYQLNQFTNATTGNTIIHTLINYSRIEPLRQLLDLLKEQDRLDKIINIQNNDGDTALHFACTFGHVQLAKDMVRYYKANKNVYDLQHRFPFYCIPTTDPLNQRPDFLKPDEDKVQELEELIRKQKEDLEELKKKPKTTKKKASKRAVIEIESEEEEKPKRSTRKKTKKQEELSDEEMKDEEEEKPKRVKLTRKAKKKQESSAEEEEDDEEEEEEKPKRKPRTSKKKK